MEKLNIIALPQFEKELKKLAKKHPSIDSDFERFLKEISDNPFAGTKLGNNCFKVRMNIKSKRAGKRGGARVITCVKLVSTKLYLVSVFDKADKDSISREEIDLILKKSGVL